MRCRFGENAAIHFQDQLATLGLQLGGNPYERSRGKTVDGWQLRDRASWAVFHTQFDKHSDVRTSLLSCWKAGKSGISAPVRVSSRGIPAHMIRTLETTNYD